MPSEPPTAVVVRVKVPPGHIQSTGQDEFSLGSLSTALPVAALRQRIQTLLPSQPLPQQQRILYGGRALIDDGQSLADALNIRRDPAQIEYVIHLLIRDGAEYGRSGTNTPHANHAEQRPLQPQPIHGQPINVPGMMQMPHLQHFLQMQPGLMQGLARTASQTSNHPVQQAQHQGAPETQQSNVQGVSTPQQAQSPPAPPRPHHHQHHHHHHPHHMQQSPAPHTPGQVPPRPISGQDVRVEGVGPNGERFSIHQHTVNLPFGMQPGQIPQHMPMAMPGLPFQQPHGHLHGMPAHIPGFPLPIPMPGMVHQGQAAQPPTVSALDRARQNMTEMRRMLEELRAQNANDESQSRITQLEQRMQAINDYIDPFRLSSGPQPSNNTDTRNAGGQAQQRAAPMTPLMRPLTQQPVNFALPLMPMLHHDIPQALPPQQPPSTAPVSAYILASSEGPRALVFTPEHGTFTANFPSSRQNQGVLPTDPAQSSNALALQPTPTGQTGAVQEAAQAAAAQEGAAAPPALAQQPDDPFAAFQPIMNHLWFLLRIMIFAYFLLGSNFGWRKPVALALIGAGFWMIRIGLFGNGGVIRRWWDDIVRIDDVRARILRGRLQRMGINVDEALAQAQDQGQANGNEPAAVVGAAQDGQQRQQPFPTPEQLAQRLLRQNQNDPIRRLREQIRPVERALALFLASLWPGVGERYVQALDQAREEEETARRAVELQQQEEARQKSEEDEKVAAEETKGTDAMENSNDQASTSESKLSEAKHESEVTGTAIAGSSGS